jgi:hypothetical protein
MSRHMRKRGKRSSREEVKKNACNRTLLIVNDAYYELYFNLSDFTHGHEISKSHFISLQIYMFSIGW